MKFIAGIGGGLIIASIAALLCAVVCDSFGLDMITWGITIFLIVFCIGIISSAWSKSDIDTLRRLYMSSGILCCWFPIAGFLPRSNSGSIVEVFVGSGRLFWGLVVGIVLIIISYLIGLKDITSTSTTGGITPQSY